MTKKILYIITLLCTLISVAVILFWSNDEIKKNKKIYSDIKFFESGNTIEEQSNKKDSGAEKNKEFSQNNDKKNINNSGKATATATETLSVFKVSKDDIQSKLSLADKEKILNAAMKLSPVDYARIKQYVELENSEEGIRKSMKLLKERLSEKDYNKVRETTSKFLNMDLIEK